MQKMRLKIPFRYREIAKNKNNSLSYDVNGHVYSKNQNPPNVLVSQKSKPKSA